MYRRVERGGYKVLLFISLLGILILLGLANRAGMNNYLLNGFYENSFRREIPLADVRSTHNEGKSFASSGLFKIIGCGLNRELNLLGTGYVQAEGVKNKSVATSASVNKKGNERINEFSFDYGAYEKRNIKGNRSYSDKNLVAEVYNPALVFSYPQDKPQVLIYHTHTGEGYGVEEGGQRDNDINVVAVGKALAEELENYGIRVIHDTTIHDDIDYNKSYYYSVKTLDKYLEKYGDMDLVIDIHRDWAPNKSVVTTRLNGKEVAKIAFVYATANKNFDHNHKLASDLLKITDSLFPALLRDNREFFYNKGTNYFNQHKSKGSVLIEVGAYLNKVEEAKETAKYLGRIMAEYLYKKYTEV